MTVAITDMGPFSAVLRLPTMVNAGAPDAYITLQTLSVGDNVAILDASAGTWVTVALVSDGATGVAIPLDPNDETVVRDVVNAPCTLIEGDSGTVVIEANVVNGAATSVANDFNTVGDSFIEIVKAGAVDADCDGTPETAFATTGLSAEPTQCIIWQVIVTNSSNESVCEVNLEDTAPPFTTLYQSGIWASAPLITSEPSPGAGVCSYNSPDIQCMVGNTLDINGDSVNESHCLRGGEAAEVRFAVAID